MEEEAPVLHVPARGDYAVRALTAMALTAADGPRRGDHLAAEQGIPRRFLEVVLADLRSAGLVEARRGHHGGYWLARPAELISVLDVLTAIGAIGTAPEPRDASPVVDVEADSGAVDARAIAATADVLWAELLRTNRSMLQKVTIADLARRSTLPTGP